MKLIATALLALLLPMFVHATDKPLKKETDDGKGDYQPKSDIGKPTKRIGAATRTWSQPTTTKEDQRTRTEDVQPPKSDPHEKKDR